MKNIIIIGVGRFGLVLAKELSSAGYEVLAVDRDEQKIQEVSNYVTHAVEADFTDERSLGKLGVDEFDIGIVGIGADLYDNVAATYILREFEIPYILVKAKDDLHGKILKELGVDKVVYPEREVGTEIAREIKSDF
jgi:trk system potassium uptake protein TrkA